MGSLMEHVSSVLRRAGLVQRDPGPFIRQVATKRLDESRPCQPDRQMEVPVAWQDVPDRLSVRPAYFTSESHLRQHGRADYSYADAEIMEFGARLYTALRKRGIPFFVHCCYRDAETQASLHAKGHSKAAFGSSPHNVGRAVDLVHSTYAWELTRQEWSYIGRLGKDVAQTMGIDVTWGGDWSFYDPAHWQLTDWRIDPPPLHKEGLQTRLTPSRILRMHPRS